ncbi:preprotein translocase subunit SecG [bacterium M21]|nr:preprotein translocase subunit SecG [bacterium M21]
MDIVLYLMYGVLVVVAVLLILVILVQRSKAGGGLGGLATTNAGVEEAFGSGAGNVLIKATVTLAIVFVLNIFGIGLLQSAQKHTADSGLDVAAIEEVDDSAAVTPADAKDVAAPTTEEAKIEAPAAVPAAPAKLAAPVKAEEAPKAK